MGTIIQEGYYRGVIVSGGFGKSPGGLPQETWMLKASEVYDPEGQEYLSADSEADEITWYGVLFNHNDSENKNNKQVKKITGWDGADFNALADMELTDVPLSWRVEYGRGDYAGVLGVGWVDVPDASPTRSVTKLDKPEIDALQARFAGKLAATKAPVKAVSAKSTKKTTKKTSEKPGSRPVAPKTTPPTETTEPVGACSADDAYNECFALSGAVEGEPSGDKLNTVWKEEVKEVNIDETQITGEQWFEIKGRVIKRTSKV